MSHQTFIWVDLESLLSEPGVRDTNVFLMFNNVIVNLIAENMCKNLTFDPLFTSLIATALSSPGTAFSELPWGE